MFGQAGCDNVFYHFAKIACKWYRAVINGVTLIPLFENGGYTCFGPVFWDLSCVNWLLEENCEEATISLLKFLRTTGLMEPLHENVTHDWDFAVYVCWNWMLISLSFSIFSSFCLSHFYLLQLNFFILLLYFSVSHSTGGIIILKTEAYQYR